MNYIKCPNCSKFNLNREHCAVCGTSLMISENRKQKLLQERDDALAKSSETDKNGIYERMKNHNLAPVRWLASGMKSIWLVFIGVTTLIALILSVFAG